MLPAATWYEKHDLSSTDMHPYVHAFTPAIDPPWETKSDYDIFGDLGRKVSDLAPRHLDTVEDLVAMPLQHDTADDRWLSRRRGEGLEDRRGRPDSG